MQKIFHWLGYHKWSKWVDIEENIHPYNHNHQYRECITCGKKQKRWYHS
jgi:hypothetical protein